MSDCRLKSALGYAFSATSFPLRCAGVTVKMRSPKIVLPSNYLPGNMNSPVFLSQEIITPRGIYLLVKYHSLQETWTPL